MASMPSKCPSCAKPFPLETPARFGPFCSERCRTVDLGNWVNEAYRIPTRNQDDDEDGTALSTLNTEH